MVSSTPEKVKGTPCLSKYAWKNIWYFRSKCLKDSKMVLDICKYSLFLWFWLNNYFSTKFCVWPRVSTKILGRFLEGLVKESQILSLREWAAWRCPGKIFPCGWELARKSQNLRKFSLQLWSDLNLSTFSNFSSCHEEYNIWFDSFLLDYACEFLLQMWRNEGILCKDIIWEAKVCNREMNFRFLEKQKYWRIID